MASGPVAVIEVKNFTPRPTVQTREIAPGRAVEVLLPVSGVALQLVIAAAREISEAAEARAVSTVRGGADANHDTLQKLATIIAALGIGDIAGLTTALAAKATPSDIATAIGNLINSAPGALDTLKELADAIGDDPNFAATVMNGLAGKQPIDATLTALAALTTASDRLIYATGPDAFTVTALTAYARSLLAAADAGTLKGLLALVKADVGLGAVDNTSDASKPVSTAQATAIAARLAIASNLSDVADKPTARTNLGLGSAALLAAAQPGGAATLDASTGKLLAGQIPDALLGSVRYQGGWNASTNMPALPAPATANRGWYYIVTAAGTTSLPGPNGAITDWQIGDWAVSDGTYWEKIDSSDQVISVAGLQGAITAAVLKLALAIGSADITDATTPGRAILTAASYAAMRVLLGLDKFTGVGDVAYTVLATDRTVGLTAALTAPRTWTLPAANSVNPGGSLRLVDVVGGVSATNSLTIAAAGSDLINGVASATFKAPNTDFQLVSDGVSRWTYDVQGLARGGTGAITATGARANLGLNDTAAVGFRNRLVNGNFAVNQRAAASASTAYAAGAYVMDRWKAGANGCTLSFAATANGDVTVTITAGTLVQVIEGAMYLPEGGAYVLSWAGTATARAYQGTATGAYAASPIALTGLTAGTNTTVEISTGTIGLAQIEPGATPTAFERRDDEVRRCQRYYWLAGGLSGSWGGTTSFNAAVSFPVMMRIIPTAILIKVGVNSVLEPDIALRPASSLNNIVLTTAGGRVGAVTTAASAANRAGIMEAGAIAFSAEL